MPKTQTTLKKHYPIQGLVTTLLPGSKLRFTDAPLPALDCALFPEWPYGYNSLPGVLDDFVTEVVGGRTLIKFNATVYNSSEIENFVIPNAPENIDEHGDVKEFWQFELLDQNANHLQYAAGKQYARFTCYEARPMRCGFPPSEEYLTLAPQWADTYPPTMNDQWFDMTGLPTGRYIVRRFIDPNEHYGETQAQQYNVLWDGNAMTAR